MSWLAISSAVESGVTFNDLKTIRSVARRSLAIHQQTNASRRSGFPRQEQSRWILLRRRPARSRRAGVAKQRKGDFQAARFVHAQCSVVRPRGLDANRTAVDKEGRSYMAR